MGDTIWCDVCLAFGLGEYEAASSQDWGGGLVVDVCEGHEFFFMGKKREDVIKMIQGIRDRHGTAYNIIEALEFQEE